VEEGGRHLVSFAADGHAALAARTSDAVAVRCVREGRGRRDVEEGGRVGVHLDKVVQPPGPSN
jgi:hypothetical protein